MKFLLCWGVMRPERVVKSEVEEEQQEEEEEEGETTRLAPLFPAPRRRRVRRASAGEAEWKPSLCAISEDMVMIEKKKKKEEEEEKRASSERVANSKRKTSTAQSRARVLVRSYSDDYERSHMPTIIPTFAPAPFMF